MAENDEYQLKTEKELVKDISDTDITQLLETCCTFGPYQRWVFTYLFASKLSTVMTAMSLTFISANVPFLCYPPNFNVSAIPPSLTEIEYLNMFQPDDDQCSVYNNTLTEIYYTTSPSNLSKLQCSYGRTFLTDKFSTIVSEFDLVCERKWLKSTLQSVYFVGYLVGSLIFGILSDRYGRKPILFLANTCIIVCGIGKIFVPEFVILMTLHCIQASGYIGVALSTYALSMITRDATGGYEVKIAYDDGLTRDVTGGSVFREGMITRDATGGYEVKIAYDDGLTRDVTGGSVFREGMITRDATGGYEVKIAYDDGLTRDVTGGSVFREGMITRDATGGYEVKIAYDDGLTRDVTGGSVFREALEFASANRRTSLSFWYMSMHPFIAIFLPGLAYVLPDWHYLELTLCLLPIINCFFWKCIPESPRWLVGRKRFAEALALFRKIMKKNKIHHQEVFNMLTTNENSSAKSSFQENIHDKRISHKAKHYSFIDLFKTFQLSIITLNICFSWFVISMLYYGITLNSVEMAGNRYLNFLLMMAVELPSQLCSYYLFTRFDHRKPISFFMMFSGLNCIISNLVTKGSFWFPLILVVLGKFGISAAYGSIYLLSAEIFPTVVRTNGLGVASIFARFGGIAATFILQLSSYVKWLPLSIYGLLSLTSGLLLLLLPETKHRDLPQTLDDLKNWKK